LANEAAIIPFPKEEVTPPVTKMYLVWFIVLLLCCCCDKYDLSVIKSCKDRF